MKVKIYGRSLSENYIRSFRYLEKRGKLERVEYVGARPIYYTLIKLNNRFAIFRKLRAIFRGNGNFIKNEPTSKDIVKSFFAPITLLFTKDIIVVGFPPYSKMIYYMLLLKFLKKKVIYQNSWPYWDEKKYNVKPIIGSIALWGIFLKNMKTLTFTRKAADELKIKGANAFYIPHPVDTRVFKPAKEKPSRKIRVLYVGRLNEEKGIRSILNVAERISRKNVEFLFVGQGKLETLVREKERIGRVKYLGFVDDREKLAQIYASSDILVLNSYDTETWEEVFGIVLIEAMASGLPVVSTDCIGPRELVINGKNGFLIPQKDEDELMDKLETLINDEALRRKMGLEGRKLVVDNYDVENVANELFAALKLNC